MIEAIIEHIREQGFIVDVRPMTLVIRKYVKEELISLQWMIHPFDLAALPLEWWYLQSDRKMNEIREAIAVRYSA